MNHHCHAHKCKTPTAPKLFMCGKHWKQLTPEMQDSVWANYRRGQERDKNPSVAYIRATNAAKLFLAKQEYPQDVEGLKKLYAMAERAFEKRASQTLR